LGNRALNFQLIFAKNRGLGMVRVNRDAGQVVAGDAVTNIKNYYNAPRISSSLLAFFWARQALHL
jgi:hypothetical protein